MDSQELVELLNYYDCEVVKQICHKYGLSADVALRRFVGSQTYQMLRNPKMAMWEFSPLGIFDIWESEQVTGNPRNSLYIRRD